MKKAIFLTVAAVVLAVAGANAQSFNKNDWFLDANLSSLGLAHSFVDGESATAFDLNVGGGYFLSDKFAVEAAFGIGIIEDVNAFTFGAGVRYYPYENLFASVGYRGNKVESIDLESNLAVSVGYDLFLSEKVFFEPAVFYQRTLDDIGVNTIGLSLGVGVRF
ncbi:MAG: type IX secretion system membrane protein PorP/SprF [Alistipes sp.]|jgi:opacity protein-like surface antigen|nr:type IX secretion system membrane protein PorP/SprF [Alistipes sp.]